MSREANFTDLAELISRIDEPRISKSHATKVRDHYTSNSGMYNDGMLGTGVGCH